jgi:hypothetical protein
MSDTTTTTAVEMIDIPEDATPKARDRIVALAAEKAQLRAQLDSLQAKVGEASRWQSEAETARADYAKAQAEWQAQQTTWQTERAMLAAGITDPEAPDIVQAAYGKVQPGEGGAKPTLAEWLANREALPKGVRAYLPDGAAQPAPAAANAAATAQAVTPKVNAGASATAEPVKTFTPDAIQRMLGTPAGRAEYAKHRAAILASLK